MNELDKISPLGENENRIAAACEAAKPEAAACGETESPSEAISMAADSVTEKACVETESPSEAISEATDRMGEEKPSRRFHSMSKEELRDALRDIVESGDWTAHKDVAAVKQAFYVIKNREDDDALAKFVEDGNSPADFTAPADAVESEVKSLLGRFKASRTAYLEAEEARRKDNLEQKLKIIEDIRKLSEDIDNIGKQFPIFKELQQQFRDIKEIPATSETETWAAFQSAVEQFYDHLKLNKELRDLDFKKNLEQKREIIAQANALAEEADVIEAFKKLQTLHDQWRETGPVAKELRDEIWGEFKDASTFVNKRHQDYHLERKAVEQANEDAKTALCGELEAVTAELPGTFAGWDAATKKVLDIQERWKKLGFASRKANTRLFSQYRSLCDTFFTEKAAYFKKSKEEQAANLARKIALCEKAEALQATDDIRKAAEEVVRMQAEWKTIGGVPRKHSDEIWSRFNKACDFFFEERKRRSAEQRKVETANLEAKRAIIARLKELPTDGDRREVMPKIKELQAEWQQTGHVPYKHKDQVNTEYREVVNALYDAFSARESRAKISDFEGRLDAIDGDGGKLHGERQRLLRALDQKRAELKTFENNMGFFNAKSKAGQSMLQEISRRADRIKKEISELEQKMAIVDSKID